MVLTQRLARPFFRFSSLHSSESERDRALRQVVLAGAKCEAGAAACAHLAQIAKEYGHHLVAADLSILPGAWHDRLSFWNSQLAVLTAVENPLVVKVGGRDKVRTFMLWLRYDADLPVKPLFPPLALAEQLWSEGRRDEAIAECRKAVASEREKAAAWHLLGALVGEHLARRGVAGALQEALHALRRAHELDPNWVHPPMEIGIVLCNGGRHQEAEETFAAAAHLANKTAHFQLVRGQNLVHLGEQDEAVPFLRAALKLEPENVEARSALADALDACGRRSEAKRVRLRAQ